MFHVVSRKFRIIKGSLDVLVVNHDAALNPSSKLECNLAHFGTVFCSKSLIPVWVSGVPLIPPSACLLGNFFASPHYETSHEGHSFSLLQLLSECLWVSAQAKARARMKHDFYAQRRCSCVSVWWVTKQAACLCGFSYSVCVCVERRGCGARWLKGEKQRFPSQCWLRSGR